MKYEVGEYLHLYWDYGSEEFHSVKGHLSLEQFNKAYELYTGESNKFTQIEHIYGRWAMAGQGEWGECKTELIPYAAPGRGRFPLTVAWLNDRARSSCLYVDKNNA
jgi:hypothetical protein